MADQHITHEFNETPFSLPEIITRLFTGNCSPFSSVRWHQQPHRELSGKASGTNIDMQWRSWTNNDKYFTGIYFLKQQAKSRSEEENQSEWVDRERERERAKSRSSAPVESQCCHKPGLEPWKAFIWRKMSNIHSNSSVRPKTMKIWLPWQS